MNFSFLEQSARAVVDKFMFPKKIDQLIADFSRHKMSTYGALKARFTAADFNELVRRAFGPALIKIDLDDDIITNAESILKDVEATIREEVDWISVNGQREYAFGCTLFVYDDISPIDIGPVRFEPRQIWLERKASNGRWARVGADGRIERFGHRIADGPVSKIATRRISSAWNGKKLRDRKRSADSHYEQGIIRAIGDCPYVCSVKIPGFGGKTGRDKALISARLALATISLIWEKPSKTLDGLNLLFDREMHGKYTLSFTSDGLVLGGSAKSNMPHAPWVARDQLEEYLKEYTRRFAIAGEAIDYLLSPSDANRPEMMNTLAHALLWFHEGCRESADLIAIVKFAAALDALAGGRGKTIEICKLINARLGITHDQKIHRDGRTLKWVVERIFNEGRSRAIHGTSDKLQHDWSETRRTAEWLTRICLVTCMDWIDANPSSDDPKRLLQQS